MSERPNPHRVADEPGQVGTALRFVLAATVVAVGAGIAAAYFSTVLAFVEHLSFGFSSGTLAEAVATIAPTRRFLTVATAGVVVALCWFGLRRWGPVIPTVDDMVGGRGVAGRWVLLDTTLQVAAVAAGASIGREGAPRQLGGYCGQRAALRFRCSDLQRRVLVAGGAGAGLAALYHIPLGATLFVVEVIVGVSALRAWGYRISVAVAICVVAMCEVGAAVARLIDHVVLSGAHPVYERVPVHPDIATLVAAVPLGVLGVIAGLGFGRLLRAVRRHTPTGRHQLWAMPLGFLVLALMSLWLPLVLGNGHAMAQNIIAGHVGLGAAAALAVAKPLATVMISGVGVTGGRLTPALATGCAFGAVVALVAATVAPGFSGQLAPLAVLGAAAFLGGALDAPLVGAVIAGELLVGSQASAMLWVALAVVVVAGIGGRTLWSRLGRRRSPA